MSDPHMPARLKLANVELDDFSFEEITAIAANAIDARKENIFIVTLDILGAYNSIFDAAYHKTIMNADIITCDGAGLKLLTFLKWPGYIKNKVSGVDLSSSFLDLASARGYRMAFIGAKPAIIDSLEKLVREKYRGAGGFFFHHGYFDSRQRASVIEKLAGFKPDIVLIALGNPAQEKMIREIMHLFKGTIFMGVGGSFDVLSGSLKRAPLFMRRLYLEWLYRLVQQPSRIFRMMNIPKYVFYVLFSEAIRWITRK